LNRPTQAFEDMLRTYFADFLDLVEPGLIQRLDLDQVAFPCREDLDAWPEEESRGLGLLADVFTRRGRRLSVLVQVELQAGCRECLEERLLGWYLRLALEGRQPARMIVLFLKGGRPGPNLEWIVDEVDGEELLRVPYLSFGLEEHPADGYLDRSEPVAWALSAFMRPAGRSLEEHLRICLEKIAGLAC
jgi:hypothetical protein